MKFTRQLSPETHELITWLRAQRGVLQQWLSTNERAYAFELIGEIGEPAAIPHLLDFALDRNTKIRQAARSAIVMLTRNVPAHEFFWLDELIRRHIRWDSPWSMLEPRELSVLVQGPADQTLLYLASTHTNGYVREAAIRAFGKSTTCEELPYLLIRMNDWVEQVREAALDAVLTRLVPENASSIVGYLSAIFQLQGCSRADHAPLLDRVIELLTSKECALHLIDGLHSTETQVRRISFDIGRKLKGRIRKPLLSEALRSFDLIVRLEAAKMVCDRPAGFDLRNIVDGFLNDRYPPIKILGLNAIRTYFRREAESRLRIGLFDRVHPVRRYCQYYLRTEHNVDPADLYVAGLNNEHPLLATSIIGLYETGRSGYSSAILSALESPRSSVRAAAIIYVGKFANPDEVARIWDAIQDPSPSVSKIAVKALLSRRERIDVEQINDAVIGSQIRHVRIGMLKLATNLPHWDQPLVILPALGSGDEQVSQVARALWEGWMAPRNAVARPSEQQRVRLEKTYDTFGDRLSKREKSEFEFVFRVSLSNA